MQIDTENPFGNSKSHKILWETMKSIDVKHREFISTTISEFFTTTNQLYKHDIFHKETLSHLLLELNTNKVQKYLGKDVSFFRNVLMGHLRDLKKICK